MHFLEYFKSFLLCFFIILSVPLSSARPAAEIMASKEQQQQQHPHHHHNNNHQRSSNLAKICGSQHRRQLTLVEIERAVNQTKLLCDRAMNEAERIGDNYVSSHSLIFNSSLFQLPHIV